MGAGGSFHSWVTVIVCGCWALIVGAGLLSMGAGSLFVGVGLLIAGCGVRSPGRVVHACWFVVCGCGGDVSSAVGSSLARLEGTGVGVLTVDGSIDNNNERRHRHRSSFSCHVAEGDVAPANVSG